MQPKIYKLGATDFVAELDTREFLRETLGEQDGDLSAMWEAWLDADESRTEDDYAEWLELIGFKLVCEDNVYNHEQDFESVFVYRVAQRAAGGKADWIYDDVIVLVNIHRGGDVRGNYGATQIYRSDSLADCGFLNWVAGWYIESAVDKDDVVLDEAEIREVDEQWQAGYSSSPTSELRSSIKEVHEITGGWVDVTLDNGWRARVAPHWYP